MGAELGGVALACSFRVPEARTPGSGPSRDVMPLASPRSELPACGAPRPGHHLAPGGFLCLVSGCVFRCLPGGSSPPAPPHFPGARAGSSPAVCAFSAPLLCLPPSRSPWPRAPHKAPRADGVEDGGAQHSDRRDLTKSDGLLGGSVRVAVRGGPLSRAPGPLPCLPLCWADGGLRLARPAHSR